MLRLDMRTSSIFNFDFQFSKTITSSTASETLGTPIYNGVSRVQNWKVFFNIQDKLPGKSLLVYKRLHVPYKAELSWELHSDLGVRHDSLQKKQSVLLHLPAQIRFRLEENSSHVGGQNSLTSEGEQNSLHNSLREKHLELSTHTWF